MLFAYVDNRDTVNFVVCCHDSIIPLVHYDNMPMQYITIFNGCKNDNFHIKINIFPIFALPR